MICLDTSVIIDLFHGEETVSRRLDNVETTPAITYPIICELYKGVYKSSKPEEGERELEKLLKHLHIISPGTKAAKIFGKLKERHPEKSEFDLMIAGICIAADTTLLTRDTDFTDIDSLTTEVL